MAIFEPVDERLGDYADGAYWEATPNGCDGLFTVTCDGEYAGIMTSREFHDHVEKMREAGKKRRHEETYGVDDENE